MSWQCSFADAQRGAVFNLVRRKAEHRNAAAIADSARESGEAMLILDRALAAQPWLSGDSFGVADVPMGVYAHSFFTLAMARPDVPPLRAWYERLRQTPGHASYEERRVGKGGVSKCGVRR